MKRETKIYFDGVVEFVLEQGLLPRYNNRGRDNLESRSKDKLRVRKTLN